MSGHAGQNISPDVRNSGFGALTRLGPPGKGAGSGTLSRPPWRSEPTARDPSELY